MTKLKIKKLHPDAVEPRYATDGSGAFDIPAYLHEATRWRGARLNPENTLTLGTGLSFEIPEGHVMLVFSRSGHGFNRDIRLANCVGVIDSDYRGELKVKLTHDGGEYADTLTVQHGDFVAQAMIVPIPKVEFEFVQSLSDTARGTGGFGSTGA